MSTAGELSGTGAPFFGQRQDYERVETDWYVEPAWAVELLLDAYPIEGPVWDPACGMGTIPKECESKGIRAFGSDIVQRDPLYPRHDFLGSVGNPLVGGRKIEAIITNPPYGKVAEAFIRKALALKVPKVAVLVQAKFPYSQARYRLFHDHPPARLLFLSDRPSMPPGELLVAGKIKAAGGKMDFLWIVWDTTHRVPITTCGWLKRT